MTLPSDLLLAISATGGGKVALVVGAGCSVEPPTSIPVAAICSDRVHQRLIADGVLAEGDCSDSRDLSAVADSVFKKTGSQRDVVKRLLDEFALKLPAPNEGYRIAAALLAEGTVTSVVTLNYDLAISVAVSELGMGNSIGVVESPEQLENASSFSVYYLHRSANETDPDKWVLRTSVLEAEWRDHWEEIITTKVLATGVVVFAGLGSPIAVLLASTEKLRNAMPTATKIYQVDPSDKEKSAFFERLQPNEYIQQPWSAFMRELSDRLARSHVARVLNASEAKRKEDALADEDCASILKRVSSLGVVGGGQLRSRWFFDDRPYIRMSDLSEGLMADIVLGLAMLERISQSSAIIFEDGVVEFRRAGRTVAAVLVASGQGRRGRVAIEARVGERLRNQRPSGAPTAVLVFGTSDWIEPAPPENIVRGDNAGGDILGHSGLQMIHIGELRTTPDRVGDVVP